MSADKLAEALRGEAAAKANLEAQQDRMQQANALINGERRPGSGLFGALSNNLRRSRGYEQRREVEPLLKQARQAYTQRYGSKQIYEAQVSEENSRLNRARQAEQDRIAADKIAYGRRQDEQDINREDAEIERGLNEVNSVATFIDTLNPDAPPVRGRITAQGAFDAQGNPLPGNFVEQSTQQGGRNPGGVKGFTALTTNLNTIGRVDNAIRVAQDFTADDFKSLVSSTTLTEGLKSAMTPEVFEQFIQTNASSFSPRVKAFMERVAFLSSAQRKEFFGAALTVMERADSQKYTPAATSAALEAIIRRLGMFDEDARMQIRNGGWDAEVPYTAYADFISQRGDPMDSDTDYSEPPAPPADPADPFPGYPGFIIVE